MIILIDLNKGQTTHIYEDLETAYKEATKMKENPEKTIPLYLWEYKDGKFKYLGPYV
jgi:hypothetical protein